MRTVRLGDVAALIRGVSYDGGEASLVHRSGFAPLLRAGNIMGELVLERDLVWVPDARIARTQWMLPGDIAMCLSSGSSDVVGKTGLLNKAFRGSVGAFCAIVRPGGRP